MNSDLNSNMYKIQLSIHQSTTPSIHTAKYPFNISKMSLKYNYISNIEIKNVFFQEERTKNWSHC